MKVFSTLKAQFKSITWLKRKDVIKSTVLTVATVVVIGVLINFIDLGLKSIIGLIC